MGGETKERVLARRPEASQHFRVDASAMTYGELWAASKLGFPINVAMKLLGVRGPLAVLAPLSTSLQSLAWDELPERGHQRLRKLVEELERLGFGEALLFAEDWRASKLDCVSVALLDESRTTLVLAMYTCFYTVSGMRSAEHVDNVFYSFTDDGRVLMTRSSKYRMRQPPEYDVVHIGDVPPREVASVHAERRSKRATTGQPYRAAEEWTAIEASEVPAKILALSRRETQFQVERGVYVPATAEEFAMLTPRDSSRDALDS